MRIALVHDLPPGGALRFVRETTRRSAAEHRYDLVTAAGAGVDADLAEAVHAVVEVDVAKPAARLPGRVGDLFEFFARQRAIAQAIDDGAYDVALVHPSRITQAPPVLTALRDTPSLYFMHEVRRRTYEHGYRTSVASRRGLSTRPRALAGSLVEHRLAAADRQATGAATAVVANSVFTIESIARVYGRQATLCHPGVDFDCFRPPVARTHDTVLSVGALDPSKGHDRCLAAMALLPRDRYPALTVAYERSDPAFERRLREQAAALDIDLRLRARVSDAELAALYATASVTVAAAPLEPLGLTVLESIATGTPVVALRQGGYRETVTDGVNGRLVDADPCSLAHAIVAVTELARRTTPEAIRASVCGYWTWDRCVRDLHRALHRTVQS